MRGSIDHARLPAAQGPHLVRFLAYAWCEFITEWRAAARRRRTVQQLKRMDRRLLADVGIPRGQIRDVADAMEVARSPWQPSDRDCAPPAAWLDARPSL